MFIRMARREQLYVLIFVILVIDIASGLYISHRSMNKNVGAKFMVVCRDDSGLTVKWQGPKGAINRNTRPQLQNGAYGTAIYFDKVRLEDAGIYTCIVLNSPKTRGTFLLQVEEPLNFNNIQTKQTGIEGDTFTLKCEVNKMVEITWVSNNNNTGKNYEQRPEGLFFANLERADEGVYECMAEDPQRGRMVTVNIFLSVEYKPRLTDDVFAEVYTLLNEAVNLTCEVEANPPPMFRWRNHETGEIVQISDFKSILMLNVTEDTLGMYQCIANNSIGEVNKFFDVQLGVHPEIPTNIELIESSADSLQIKVEVSDIPYDTRDHPVMDPQWIVIEYTPLDKDEWRAVEFNYSTDLITLPGLSKKTKYQLRAATKNVAGSSPFFFNERMTFETSTATSVHIAAPIILYLSVLLISMFWMA